MTVTVANVDTTTDSFGAWVTKTNLIATALSNVVITTDSNTTVGNAAISGTFTSDKLTTTTLSGGNTSTAANLNISTNTVFSQNAVFNSTRVNLGSGANVQINTGNSTVRVLTVNSAASNTIVASRLTFSDISDISVSSLSNGQILVYNSATLKWNNSNVLSINASSSTLTVNAIIANSSVLVGNATNYVSVNSSMVTVNGSPALLKVFYSNNVQAFP